MAESTVQENKVFEISAAKWAEMKKWMEEHNKQCQIGKARCYRGFTPTSKYIFTFRPTGIGDNPKVLCDCGEGFYSSAGDEDI